MKLKKNKDEENARQIEWKKKRLIKNLESETENLRKER